MAKSWFGLNPTGRFEVTIDENWNEPLINGKRAITFSDVGLIAVIHQLCEDVKVSDLKLKFEQTNLKNISKINAELRAEITRLKTELHEISRIKAERQKSSGSELA